jgi:hypothetical protein
MKFVVRTVSLGTCLNGSDINLVRQHVCNLRNMRSSFRTEFKVGVTLTDTDWKLASYTE